MIINFFSTITLFFFFKLFLSSAALTQVKKQKSLERKENIINKISSCIDRHENLFILSIKNTTSNEMRLFRKIFETTGSIIAAKKSLMSKALSIHYGPQYEEILEGLVISEKVKDFQVALLFTDLDKESVDSHVKNFGSDRFSIPGDVAEKTIFISNENLESCPSSMQPYLEKIGVPVVVKDGAIILLQNPMQITTEGEILTANQAKILKCFKIRISRSSMTLHKAINTKELIDI